MNNAKLKPGSTIRLLSYNGKPRNTIGTVVSINIKKDKITITVKEEMKSGLDVVRSFNLDRLMFE
jgi:hypothetical protein